MMKKAIRISSAVFAAAVLVIGTAFWVYKPARTIWPELFGMTRVSGNIFVDDVSRGSNVVTLLKNSLNEVQQESFHFRRLPRILFCAYQTTYESFGFKQSISRTVDGIAIVIGPGGFQSYFVKHELIHFWQHENLGRSFMRHYPAWLIEGMAYSLSGDPRHPLAEPWESYRVQFDAWYANHENLFEESRRLYK